MCLLRLERKEKTTLVYIPSLNCPPVQDFVGGSYKLFSPTPSRAPRRPQIPRDASPSSDELIAGREAAPPVHSLERPEVQSQVFDAVGAAMIKIYAGRHFGPPARVGRSRHGPAFAAEDIDQDRTSTTIPDIPRPRRDRFLFGNPTTIPSMPYASWSSIFKGDHFVV